MQKWIIVVISLFFVSVILAQDTLNPNGYNIFYYPNGVKSSEGNMLNGQPEGWWKAYNTEGILISEGNRKNHQLDSLWIFYNPQGEKSLVIHYQKGKKNGERVQYFENEFVVENFENDTITGSVNTFFADSTLKKTTPYEFGVQHGMEKEFNHDGLVIAVTNYYRGVMLRKEFINRTDNFGFRQGKWKYFWANGNLRLEGSYKNDKRDGFFKFYDISGNFEKVEKYVNGELIVDAPEVKVLDRKVSYHPNGQPAITATYYKGIPEGIRREYDSTGKVIKGYVFQNGIIRFEGVTDDNGLRQGLWKEFYETGELRSEGHYLNSNFTGNWKFYFQEDQQIEIMGSYNKKGEKIGEWIWYYANRQPMVIENWENGLLQGEYVDYDEYGNELSKGLYEHGEKDGFWSYRNGTATEKGSYYDGMRHGTWKQWFGDGTLFTEIEYDQNFPNGKAVTYWENGLVKNKGKYVAGLKDGLWYQYDENGTLSLTTLFKEGLELRWNNYVIK